jgi:hypothetical protein
VKLCIVFLGTVELPACRIVVSQKQRLYRFRLLTLISLVVVLQVCVASGRTLRGEPKVRCKTCKHYMVAAELGDRKSCPLCHSPLLPKHQQDPGTATSSTMSRSSSVSSSASRSTGKHVRHAG